jgi:DNA polymerase (family 10)
VSLWFKGASFLMSTVIDIPFLPSETLCEIPGAGDLVERPSGPPITLPRYEDPAAIPAGRWPLAMARSLAERIVAELGPYCEQIEIAGSIRRGRGHVGDIDLVALPRDRAAFKERLGRHCQLEIKGEQNIIARLKNGLQLDVFLARGEERTLLDVTPGNWGTLLLCRTGSRAFNVWLAEQAKAKGYHWNPYRGLEQRGLVVASETEEQLFQRLGLAWIRPEERER